METKTQKSSSRGHERCQHISRSQFQQRFELGIVWALLMVWSKVLMCAKAENLNQRDLEKKKSWKVKVKYKSLCFGPGPSSSITSILFLLLYCFVYNVCFRKMCCRVLTRTHISQHALGRRRRYTQSRASSLAALTANDLCGIYLVLSHILTVAVLNSRASVVRKVDSKPAAHCKTKWLEFL